MTPCWIWAGRRNADGYGLVTLPARPGRVSTTYRAHRIAWEEAFGPIPEGMWVRHVVCDNPPCVRPDHLALGTSQQNTADRQRKQRQARGTRAARSRLTAEQVRAIRSRHAAGESQVALAAAFGVVKGTINFIVHGRTWKAD